MLSDKKDRKSQGRENKRMLILFTNGAKNLYISTNECRHFIKETFSSYGVQRNEKRFNKRKIIIIICNHQDVNTFVCTYSVTRGTK